METDGQEAAAPDRPEDHPAEEAASSEGGDAESTAASDQASEGTSAGGGDAAAAAAAAGGDGAADPAAAAGDGAAEAAETADEDLQSVRFKLLSPLGGRSLDFCLYKKKANSDVNEELQTHLNNVFGLEMGIKEAFEKAMQVASWKDVAWTDVEQIGKVITKLNRCISSVVQLWRGATRPATEVEWFQQQYCNAAQLTKLSNYTFNRAVQNAAKLNKCYKAFSSLTYGETSFNQVQIILDKLKLTDKDVFVDLGSGVGHVVTFTAGYTNVKRAVGIEINELPAVKASFMKREFEQMMSWYGKKHRPFDLIKGDFLDDKYRELITKEATVVFINNYAFDALLMFHIKQMVMDMQDGTRIICTNSLLEERNAEADQDAGKTRPVTGRTLNRQTVDMMLDMSKFPLCELPVSWSKGDTVKFYLFTVNHRKIEQIFNEANNSAQGSSRSGSAESGVQNDNQNADSSMADTINEVASVKGGGGRIVKMYEDDEDSDDEDYEQPGTSRRWTGLKAAEKRRAASPEYTPKKKSSTGASSSRSSLSTSHKKDAAKKDRKDKPAASSSSSRVGGRAAAGAAGAATPSLANNDDAVHSAMHGMIKQEQKKIKAEDGVFPHRPARSAIDNGGLVTLDPSNPMDRHLSKSATRRGPKKSIGVGANGAAGGDANKENRRRRRASSSISDSIADSTTSGNSSSSNGRSSNTARSRSNGRGRSTVRNASAVPVPPTPGADCKYGKVAATGASDDWDKKEAPKFAGVEGSNWFHVHAPHHNFLDAHHLEGLPKKRGGRL